MPTFVSLVTIEFNFEHFQRGLPPISCILKSPPLYALFFLHFGHLWSFYFFLVAAPKYMNEVLKFDLTQSGVLASAPYLSRFICGLLFGLLSDYFIKHDILSITSIRKYFSIFCKFLVFTISFANLNKKLFYAKFQHTSCLAYYCSVCVLWIRIPCIALHWLQLRWD